MATLASAAAVGETAVSSGRATASRMQHIWFRKLMPIDV